MILILIFRKMIKYQNVFKVHFTLYFKVHFTLFFKVHSTLYFKVHLTLIHFFYKMRWIIF